MANDAGCEICVWLIMLQYFFFKTFACEMVEFYGIIRWFGTSYVMLFLLFCSSITILFIYSLY